MEIKFDSATMVVDVVGSKADTSISPDGQWAAMHLTRNSGPIIAGNKSASDEDVSAINIDGTVDLDLKPGENIANFDFNFIQLAANLHGESSFWGRTSADGFMNINYTNPPAFPAKFAFEYNLDSLADRMPFMNLRTPAIFPKRNNQGALLGGLPFLNIDMDDHPSSRVRLRFQNKKTGGTNFLGYVLVQKKFLTAFVVREKSTKKITVLANVRWFASWEARYRWLKGVCVPYDVKGQLEVSKVDKGLRGLDDFRKDIALKITNPTTDVSETSNALVANAQKTLDLNTGALNLTYVEQWPDNSPMNFWMN